MLLDVKNISLSFTNARKETFNLLNGVNLNVEAGKVTALVGGNGTGKTTLFNIISGFEKGYSGDIVFEGRSINHFSPYKISHLGIGRLFQGGQLLENLTLMENMKLASDDQTGEQPFQSLFMPSRVKEREVMKEQKAIELLNRIFGPDNKYVGMLDQKASSFSYGEQRLLSLARLLMGNNKLLLLDEPTSGVNPVYISSIENIIKEMVRAEGITILLIEHNMQFVRNVADTCAYLDEGVIQKLGHTSEVLDDQNVRNSYLGI